MNWNSPVADEVFALAFGLRFEFADRRVEQILEAGAGHARGIADRAGDTRRDVRGRPADAGRNVD